jgi:hypothetical protein
MPNLEINVPWHRSKNITATGIERLPSTSESALFAVALGLFGDDLGPRNGEERSLNVRTPSLPFPRYRTRQELVETCENATETPPSLNKWEADVSGGSVSYGSILVGLFNALGQFNGLIVGL